MRKLTTIAGAAFAVLLCQPAFADSVKIALPVASLESMPIYIAQQMRTLLNYPLGATAAIVLLVLTGVLMLVSVWVAERRDPLP